MPNHDGFVFGELINAAKALGIKSEDVVAYRSEHNCSTQQAVEALIASK
ncbi:MAG: hypothetical protein K5840_04345 [Eubacterium sp.]|nr:hypothetical protein [Eubacterium sp.]